MHEFTYFDLPPRADVIRILLHAAGLEFQDTRLTFAEWVSVKPTTPLGMLPVLILDDKDQFCQSVVRCRSWLFLFIPFVHALTHDDLIPFCLLLVF